jgi:hypothetical protein
MRNIKGKAVFVFLSFSVAILSSCYRYGNGKEGSNNHNVGEDSIPWFVKADYIELDKIQRISKFRSAVGHDYSDDFEKDRSMKHYFEPKADIDWSAVKIFSPVDGTVVRAFEEWAGIRVHIQSKQYPAISFIIFHVKLNKPLNTGDELAAGQQIGTHIGEQTLSDIAVEVNTPNGRKLISYFDIMGDSVFRSYRARGLASREDAIISKKARDADPLTSDEKGFVTNGKLSNWIILK